MTLEDRRWQYIEGIKDDDINDINDIKADDIEEIKTDDIDDKGRKEGTWCVGEAEDDRDVDENLEMIAEGI